MMIHKLTSGFLILAVLLSGCSLPSFNLPASPGSATPLAWFDAPLPGSQFWPPNPCQVVAHASSPNGISLFELSVNGVAVSIPSPDTESQLVTLTRDCELSDPGEYRLMLRVQDKSGVWSGFAETRLVILQSENATSTPTNAPTKATTAPTETLVPSVTPELVFSSPQLSALQFYYQGNDCGPEKMTFNISVLSGSPASVFLFYRFRNNATFETSAWSPGEAMQPSGVGSFSRALYGDNIPGLFVPTGRVKPPVNYMVLYQFVGIDSGGNVLGKSVVYGDLTLSYCEY